MFPHEARIAGHQYRDSLYTFAEHYDDSSVGIYVPAGFKPEAQIRLVFYFHGWWNNIHQAVAEFDLLRQFESAGCNAVFVFPEGPKNAPDSFGGKLEESGEFAALTDDVLTVLKERRIIPATAASGDILLAGHSGAYRVIAEILNRGGLTGQIRAVCLLDALYGQFEKYAMWLERYPGSLVNIITPEGGTKSNSDEFLQNLTDWNMAFKKLETNTPQLTDYQGERIVFIYTTLGHNEVVNPFFEVFLKSGEFSRTKSE